MVKAGIGSKEAIKRQVRNRKQSEYFIDHTLMGTDIHLALELASRGERTAKEIRQFAGGNFRDFVRLEKYLKFEIK